MKILRFIFNFFAYILLFVYVYVGTSSATSLFEMKQVRRQDLGVLSVMIDNEPGKVAKWARYRPLQETDALVKILTPKSAVADPAVFFELARRHIMTGKTEEALFWSQLGRYRLRYDLLRCGTPGAIDSISRIVTGLSSPVLQELLQKSPELTKKSVRRVLDFDKKYPAANNPFFICDIAHKLERSKSPMVPKEEWGIVRSNLRTVTEDFLKDKN